MLQMCLFESDVCMCVVVVDAEGYRKQAEGTPCLGRSLEEATERKCLITRVRVTAPVSCVPHVSVTYPV